MKLDPGSAALYALIAISLVLIGAILTANEQGLGITERGSLLAGIVAVLLAVGLRIRATKGDE